jgi:hypothetical protein
MRSGPAWSIAVGEALAPPAGTVLADTGQLAAGRYELQVVMSIDAAATAVTAIVEQRDPTNTTNDWKQSVATSAAVFPLRIGPIALATNERVRVRTDPVGAAGTAAKNYGATIFYRRVGP